jgi:MATE family multidrug resistance protein
LLKIALPMIVSQSFVAVQVLLDRVLLSWHSQLEQAATGNALIWYWQFFGLLQVTAGYSSTFVAQYTGANRPHRVGPAVWQGIHFAWAAGLLFLLLVPVAPWLVSLGGPDPVVQRHETVYLRCLCFAALPMFVMAAVNGFFSGRGQTWTVLLIEAFGTGVNVLLAVPLIFGERGLPWLGLPGVPGVPELGITGAGVATVVGSWAAAALAVGLFLRRRYRTEFASLSGRRFDKPLFKRLVRFGGPAGLQVFQDVLVFNVFLLAVGWLGVAEKGATSLTLALNMVAFLPVYGLGQAVCILVGQRLGADKPAVAEKTTYTGFLWMLGYMGVVAAVYLFLPRTLTGLFRGDTEIEQYEAMAALMPGLLACVAIYSLAEAGNFAFAFALRGAGDTKFVSRLTFVLGWPVMVIPTLIAVGLGASLYWAWGFATAYIFVMATCFYLRFRGGKWKTMRVIEPTPELEDEVPEAEGEKLTV